MKIGKDLLLEVLKAVSPAVPKKGDEAIVNRVVFTGNDVAGYNDLLCIVHPFATDFKTACPADELVKIVSKHGGKDVELIYSKDAVNIKGGTKLKARLQTDPKHPHIEYVDDLITMADNEVNWQPVPEDFMEAVKLCMYSASQDVAQSHLQCVYINGNVVVASDDFRVSEFTMQNGIEDQILIPATACFEMAKLGTITQYGISEAWGFFLNEENAMLIARLTADRYDDHTQFFDFDGGKSINLPAKKILKEVGVASIMADGDLDIEKSIKVTIENGKVVLRGEKALGFTQATINDKNIQLDGNAIFGVNPNFLAEVLERTTYVDIGLDRALFTSEDGKFRHLISLSIG